MTDTVIKKNKKKRVWTLVFVLINLLVILYIGYKEFGTGDWERNLSDLEFHPVYMLAGICCFGVVLFVEFLKYYLMIRDIDGKKDPRTALGCAITGKYYDNITPLGSGGEAFQMVYLKGKGLSTGACAAIPIIDFMMLQAAFITITILVMIFGYGYLEDMTGFRIMAYVGLAFYALIPVLVLLFIVFPDGLHKLVASVCHLLKKIHIIKDAEKAENNAITALKSYRNSMMDLKSKPFLIVKLLGLSFIYRLFIFVMPYFALKTFGANVPFVATFCRVVMIYAVITIVPTPGNAGAAEGSFYLVFESMTGSSAFFAVLFWRMLCYYSWLTCGIVLISKKAIESHLLHPRSLNVHLKDHSDSDHSEN